MLLYILVVHFFLLMNDTLFTELFSLSIHYLMTVWIVSVFDYYEQFDLSIWMHAELYAKYMFNLNSQPVF